MLETLPAAVPRIVAVRSEVSQLMLKPAGIRIRMSLAAVIERVTGSSVIVIVLIVVGGSPTRKLWSNSEEIVGVPAAVISIVLSSSAVTVSSL